MNVVWRHLRVAVGACLLGLVLATAGGAASSSLPGGTSIEVAIDSPADGSTLPQGPVTVKGTAAIGKAAPVANTTLIYIVDVSGSTASVTSTASACPNQTVYSVNPYKDGTTLDCELLAVRDMNDAAISTGTVAKVGLIGFGGTLPAGKVTDAQALDLSPATGAQPLVAPDANTFNPGPTMPRLGTPADDLDWVLQSAYSTHYTAVGNGWPNPIGQVGFTEFTPWSDVGDTNYWAAINALNGLLASVTTPNVVAVFLSDGNSNTGSPSGQPVGAALTALESSLPVGVNLKIDTYAIGGAAQCSPATTNKGTLQQIADATGGTCQHVTDPGDTATTVPAAIASQLTSISLGLDGGTGTAPTTVSPSVPVTGPVGPVDFSSTYSSLATGTHKVCATAKGSDGGGDGDVTDCVSFTIKATPTVTVGNGSGDAGTTDEGASFPLTATTSSDPLTWTATGGEGTCVFSDPNSATTDVTCDDEGTYTLTLTADDGVNPAVSASETLTVENVAPTLAITSPGNGDVTGQDVALTAAISDPGVGALTCTIDWGDGSPTDTVSPSGGVCSASHAYSGSGSQTITVTGSDDDGASVTQTVTITVDPLDVLISLANALPPGKSLPAKAANIKADYEAGDTTAACNLLAAFVSEVQAQSGKQLTEEQANDLLSAAAAVGTFLGC